MPELPEVETIKRGLSDLILNKKIIKIKVFCEKSFIGRKTKGKVKNIRRFGKALIFDLDNGLSLLIHLRMTGQLIYDSVKKDAGAKQVELKHRYAAGHPNESFIAKLPNRQTRVIIEFENGLLFFNDQRKFGFIKVIETKDVKNDPFIKKLAKEPWEMTDEELYAKFQKHKNLAIKPTILDQTTICGLGNIYADEALFVAKIHPKRKSGTITKKETKKLLEAAREVMKESIDSGGSTLSTYLKADGTKGDYLEKFAKVFHRENKPCLNCGTKIIKIKVAGRGTHFCPKCQILSEKSQISAYDFSEKKEKND